MSNLEPGQEAQLLFEKLNEAILKQLAMLKPEITSCFSLDQIVQINQLKNSDLCLKNDEIFHLQIRGNHILQIIKRPNTKSAKGALIDQIISGIQLNHKIKFQVKRQYQYELEPLPKAIGIILYISSHQQPLDFISEEDCQNIEKFAKVLESKMVVQKNFHKLFKPLKKLGKGSSATVIEGIDLRDGKSYAVKGFKKSMGFSIQKGIFFKQVQFLRENQHPQIAKLHSIFQTENSLYMIMDKYNQNLYDFLINKGLNSEEELKAIIKGILQILHFLHSKGIMHRDIKPQNIMIRYQQFDKKQLSKRKTNVVPVLIDFGFAECQMNPEFTIYRCGTPGFIAPQILKDYMVKQEANDSFNSEISVSKKKYGKACDIFSLGCLFHILLMNKMPFKGRQKKQLIKENMEAKIDTNSKQYKLLDIHAKKLMFRMLERDPQKRITASEALKSEFFSLMMFNFKKIQIRNPFLTQKQPSAQQKSEEDEDKNLLLFQ